MKKTMLCALAVLLAVFCTACADADCKVTLHNSETMDAVCTILMDKEVLDDESGMFGDMLQQAIDTHRQTLISYGCTVEDVETDTQRGFRASAQNVSADFSMVAKMLGAGSTEVGSWKTNGKSKAFSGTIDLTGRIFGMDVSPQFLNDPNLPLGGLQGSLADVVSVTLTVTGPKGLTAENAAVSENDPNTYVFNLRIGQSNPIALSYTQSTATWYWWVGGGILLILLVAGTFLALCKKKAKAAVLQEPVTDETADENTDTEVPQNE